MSAAAWRFFTATEGDADWTAGVATPAASRGGPVGPQPISREAVDARHTTTEGVDDERFITVYARLRLRLRDGVRFPAQTGDAF